MPYLPEPIDPDEFPDRLPVIMPWMRFKIRVPVCLYPLQSVQVEVVDQLSFRGQLWYTTTVTEGDEEHYNWAFTDAYTGCCIFKSGEENYMHCSEHGLNRLKAYWRTIQFLRKERAAEIIKAQKLHAGKLSLPLYTSLFL